MSTFTQWYTWLAPTRFARVVGQRFVAGLGLISDAFQAALQTALDVDNPFVGPDDALPYQGRDRVLPRAYNETDAGYRVRLQSPMTTHASEGTVDGIETILTDAWSFLDVTVIPDADWVNDGVWSRFYVLCWADPVGWSGAFPAAAQQSLLTMIETHRAGHTVCMLAYVDFGGCYWDYNPGNWTWDEEAAYGWTWDQPCQEIVIHA
jgi:hypothetical protein